MPRPKPSTASPVWYSYPVPLEETVKKELLNLLNRKRMNDKSERIFKEVEYLLTYYVGAVDNVNKAPTLPQRNAFLSETLKLTQSLYDKLNTSSGYLKNELTKYLLLMGNQNIYVIEKDIKILLLALNRMNSQNTTDYSPTPNRDMALIQLFNSLREIFNRNANKNNTHRHTKGAFEFNSEYENALYNFITTVLNNARAEQSPSEQDNNRPATSPIFKKNEWDTQKVQRKLRDIDAHHNGNNTGT